MKALLSTLCIALLLSACQNNAPLSENSHKDNGVHSTATAQNNTNQSTITNNTLIIPKRQRPTPPTANKLLNELKLGNVWQSSPFNYDNLSDNWRLLVVSDDDLNDLNLPIVKKDRFTVTFEKSTQLNNYWIYMPNNCNSMNGEFKITKTGIKPNGYLASTEKYCAKLPKELDDNLIHNAILKGNYELLEKDKQRILKINHNNQNWFFYSDDPMSTWGLLKSFRKDRSDFYLSDFNTKNLLQKWHLYVISDNSHNPIDTSLWQRDDRTRYHLNFYQNNDRHLWLSIANQCQDIKIPFDIAHTGIIANINQIIRTNNECHLGEYYKQSDENIIYNAIYNGNYQILQNDNGLLLKISHNDRILFFVSQSYNNKEKAYWEQNRRK